MPNWCNNIVTLKHKDPALIKRIAEEGEKGLFNLFVPMPEQLRNTEKSTATPDEVYQKNIEQFGYASWYEWAHDNWGTKWDACEVDVLEQTDNSIKLTFDTAWSPPIPFFGTEWKRNNTLFVVGIERLMAKRARVGLGQYAHLAMRTVFHLDHLFPQVAFDGNIQPERGQTGKEEPFDFIRNDGSAKTNIHVVFKRNDADTESQLVFRRQIKLKVLNQRFHSRRDFNQTDVGHRTGFEVGS